MALGQIPTISLFILGVGGGGVGVSLISALKKRTTGLEQLRNAGILP